MTWVKLDDGIGEHPKIARLSDSAFALFITSIAYCNRNLTDGFVPSAVGMGQLRFCDGNTIPPIRELEAAGLWEEVAGGWNVHDYGFYQPSRESVLTERESARQRQATSRAKLRRDTEGSHGPVTGAPVPVPVPKKNQERMSDPKPTNYPPDFEAWWQVWPRREAKAAAAKAYDKARGKASAEELIAGAARYRDDPRRTAEYTAHAATWLNQERWLDEPQLASVRDTSLDLPRMDDAG